MQKQSFHSSSRRLHLTKPTSSARASKWQHAARLLALSACGALGVGVVSNASAATDVWNNTGTTWETGTDWNTGNVPTAADIASFDPTVAATSIMNPTINAADAALSLNLNNNYLGGTYSFGGTGTLTLGGTGSTGITTRGFGTQTISGPILAGASSSALLTFNVGTDSGLALAGATTATTNTGAVSINGGTLTLDNSASTTLHLSTSSVPSFVGGTLSIVGNSAGTAYTLGAASFNGGFDTVSLTPTGGAAVAVNFANGTAGSATSLRTQTYMVEQFVATSGVLGSTGGPKITVTGNPYVDAGGLLGNSATTTSQTVGFATVKDAGGVTFATYVAPTSTGGGITAATATRTAVDATTLQASTATDFTQFNAPTGQVTATAAVSPTALRITPAGAGGSLALGTNNLAANAVMLDGANDYSISGTGNFGATGTRYIYVNNAGTTLNTSIVIANAQNPTNIAGPGFTALNGTSSQNTLMPNTTTSGGVTTITSANRINLLGGVLRGNNTQLGFTSAGNGLISLRGGVLEITGGQNGVGTNADFTRLLANSTSTTAATGTTVISNGTVNWANNTTTDQGSGGFSAFGAAASVNILATTTTSAALVWNTNGFVTDGYALRFGSTQSNATLTFQNSIGLDSGTAGTYAAREISVTAGTGGDSTVLSGVISGSASSDLIKTGTGTLNLTANNTYAGRTFVQGGTLLVNGTNSGTGAVMVNNSGTLLGGGGSIAGPVTVNSGSVVSPGSTGGSSIGKLTTGALTINGQYTFNLAGSSTPAPGTTYDQLSVVGALTLNPTTSALSVVAASNAGLANGQVRYIALNDGTDAITGTFSGLAEGATVMDNLGDTYTISYVDNGDGGSVGNDISLTVSGVASVPEPTTILGGVLLAGAAGWSQRRRVRAMFTPVA